MRPRVRAGLVVSIVAVTGLSACAVLPVGPSDADLVDRVRALEGGECFQGTSDGRLDFNGEVPCDSPHRFEVLTTVPVPPELADITLEEALDVGGEANTALLQHVLPICAAEVARVTGLTDLAATVPGLAGAHLWPGISGQITSHTAPDAIWDELPAMICTFEWSDDAGNLLEVTSPTSGPLLATYGTPSAGDEMRMCLSAGKGYTVVPCAQAHDAELLFEYDAEVLLGTDFVAAVDPSAITNEQWAALDDVCRATAPDVFGAERTRTDVGLLAELFIDGWGTPAVGAGSYPVECLAIPQDPDMLLDGPVWGLRDEPARLVPAS